MDFNATVAVKGRFKFEVIKKDGTITNSGWSDNIVLDNGLLHLGDKSIMSFCRVGDGSSEPQVHQTQLDNQVGASSSPPPDYNRFADHGVNTQDGYWYWRKIYRFGEGVATGRLTEVGVGWEATGDTLFNRAIIKDARGQNTTIVVLDDEILDVSVELRVYARMSATREQFNSIVRLPNNTEETTSKRVTIQPLFIPLQPTTQVRPQPTLLGTQHPPVGYGSNVISMYTPPTRTIEPFKNQFSLPYESNHKRVLEISWGVSQGNGVPLRTVVVPTGLGVFQVEVDPVFEKTPQQVLRLSFTLSWTRYE